MSPESEADAQDALTIVAEELRALRLAHDDLRRAHTRIVESPAWRVLSKFDSLLARIPLARTLVARVARGVSRGARASGWVPRIAIRASEREQLAIVRSSLFFDADWYRAANRDVQLMDPAQHYYSCGAREGRRAGPLFNTQFYLTNNPDVAFSHLNPLVHFHLTGAREGRTAWTSEDLLDWQSSSISNAEQALERVWRRSGALAFLHRDRPVALYVSSIGNFFFRELAELCAIGLREAGYAVQVRTELDAKPVNGESALVMAPHEFYCLGGGIHLAEHPAFFGSIPIGTEQWQTQWFARALPFMLRAEQLLDINLQSADAFVRLGKQCRYLALGYSPDAPPSSVNVITARDRPVLRLKHVNRDALSATVRPLKERPLDVLFAGTWTARRSEILTELAPVLAQHNCFVHLTDVSAPLRGMDEVDGELFALLARNSKVLLNVHRSEMPYFEWHRMVLYGSWQRSVVITETSFDVPFLRNGEHYVGVKTKDLGAAIADVLAAIRRDDPAPQQMVDAGWETLTQRLALRDCMLKI